MFVYIHKFFQKITKHIDMCHVNTSCLSCHGLSWSRKTSLDNLWNSWTIAYTYSTPHPGDESPGHTRSVSSGFGGGGLKNILHPSYDVSLHPSRIARGWLSNPQNTCKHSANLLVALSVLFALRHKIWL